MEISGIFNPISAKRARDAMGVTTELAGKLDKTGGDLSGPTNFNGGASFRQPDTTGIATSSGGRGAAEVLGRGAGSAAFLQFHRPGEYAAYLGLDTDNQFKVGGWSMGAGAYKLWHEGNFDPDAFVRTDGNGIEVGRGNSGTAYIDFHSSSNSDFTARIYNQTDKFYYVASEHHFEGIVASPFIKGDNTKFEGTVTLANGTTIRAGNNIDLYCTYDYASDQYAAPRFTIKRPVPVTNSYADLEFVRDIRQAPNVDAPAGGTSHIVKIKQYVKDTKFHQWPIHVDMEFNGTGGEHCGVYSVMQKHVGSRCTTWSFCGENRDYTPEPVTGLVGMEMGMGGRGTDSRELRCAIDISTGGAQPWDAGRNEISAGIRIGPGQNLPNWTQGVNYGTPDGTATNTGYVVVKKGIELKGNMETGIDMTGLRNDFSDTAMRLPVGHKLKWSGGGVIGMEPDKLIIGHNNLIGGNAPQAAPQVYLRVLVPEVGLLRIPCYAL